MDELSRLKELADRSYNTGQFTFTDFLGMADLSMFYKNEKDFIFAHHTAFGGCEQAERKIIRFGDPDELGYSVDFPISALCIQPLSKKFSDDLNHRDFLGALMNLGIKRELLGDIFVKENEALLFCKESIADFISENLTRVKHTSVKVVQAQDTDAITAPKKEEKVIQVASGRIDAVIAKVYNLSRQDAMALFPAGLVYLNGMECTENAKALKAGDVIAVRGRGKFEYDRESGLSKKGKLNCVVLIYK